VKSTPAPALVTPRTKSGRLDWLTIRWSSHEDRLSIRPELLQVARASQPQSAVLEA